MNRPFLGILTAFFFTSIQAANLSSLDIKTPQDEKVLCIKQRVSQCMDKCPESGTINCEQSCHENAKNECRQAGE